MISTDVTFKPEAPAEVRGEFRPIPFTEAIDETGKGRRRAVDITTEGYQVAREYMVRLGPRDFADAAQTAALARTAGLDENAFRARFERFASPRNF